MSAVMLAAAQQSCTGGGWADAVVILGVCAVSAFGIWVMSR